MVLNHVWCPAAFVTAGVTITTAFASARHTGNKVDAARYLCLFLMGGVVVYIYSFLMPSYGSTCTATLFFRLLFSFANEAILQWQLTQIAPIK